MNKVKSVLLSAGISLALAFAFSCSGDDGGKGGSITNNLCGSVSYDPSIYRCESGELIGKCRGKDYYIAYEQCVDGVVVNNNSKNSSSSSSYIAQTSSSMAISSSSSKPFTYTYTLTCNLPKLGAAGIAITPPEVLCNYGKTIDSDGKAISDIKWTNAPNWSNPIAGTYSGVSVTENAGNCSGKTAICDGTLTVVTVFSKGNDIANYKTVRIGDQVWMAENLDYNVNGSRCFNDNEAYCTIYGRLYNWATAMNLPANCNNTSCSSQIVAKHRGICPSDWHIPSEDEWNTLINFVGGSSIAGWYLKSVSDLYGNYGYNKYGFSALPGGYGEIYGSEEYFNSVDATGVWWSSTEFRIFQAYSPNIFFNKDVEEVYNYSYDKRNFFVSVRCVKD